MFRSAPPRRGRRELTRHSLPTIGFRSAPPRRGRLACKVGHTIKALFRSAPPRRGRRLTNPARDFLTVVSIRAPAQGATTRYRPFRQRPWSFDPRPRAGVVGERSSARGRRTRCFDPRPRAGDDVVRRASRPGLPVSIRAPAQGATIKSVTDRRERVFRSAPPRRGRPGGRVDDLLSRLFRSAPPRRGRR